MNFPRLTPGTGCPFCSLKAKTVTQNNTRNALCGYFGRILGRGRLLFWKACCFFCLRKLFFKPTKPLKIKLRLICGNQTYSLNLTGSFYVFGILGKPSKCLALPLGAERTCWWSPRYTRVPASALLFTASRLQTWHGGKAASAARFVLRRYGSDERCPFGFPCAE